MTAPVAPTTYGMSRADSPHFERVQQVMQMRAGVRDALREARTLNGLHFGTEPPGRDPEKWSIEQEVEHVHHALRLRTALQNVYNARIDDAPYQQPPFKISTDEEREHFTSRESVKALLGEPGKLPPLMQLVTSLENLDQRMEKAVQAFDESVEAKSIARGHAADPIGESYGAAAQASHEAVMAEADLLGKLRSTERGAHKTLDQYSKTDSQAPKANSYLVHTAKKAVNTAQSATQNAVQGARERFKPRAKNLWKKVKSFGHATAEFGARITAPLAELASKAVEKGTIAPLERAQRWVGKNEVIKGHRTAIIAEKEERASLRSKAAGWLASSGEKLRDYAQASEGQTSTSDGVQRGTELSQQAPLFGRWRERGKQLPDFLKQPGIKDAIKELGVGLKNFGVEAAQGLRTEARELAQGAAGLAAGALDKVGQAQTSISTRWKQVGASVAERRARSAENRKTAQQRKVDAQQAKLDRKQATLDRKRGTASDRLIDAETAQQKREKRKDEGVSATRAGRGAERLRNFAGSSQSDTAQNGDDLAPLPAGLDPGDVLGSPSLPPTASPLHPTNVEIVSFSEPEPQVPVSPSEKRTAVPEPGDKLVASGAANGQANGKPTAPKK